jgi:hypothetical protein
MVTVLVGLVARFSVFPSTCGHFSLNRLPIPDVLPEGAGCSFLLVLMCSPRHTSSVTSFSSSRRRPPSLSSFRSIGLAWCHPLPSFLNNLNLRVLPIQPHSTTSLNLPISCRRTSFLSVTRADESLASLIKPVGYRRPGFARAIKDVSADHRRPLATLHLLGLATVLDDPRRDMCIAESQAVFIRTAGSL